MASVAARSRRAPTARFDPAMEGGTQRLLLLADLRDGIPQGQLRAYVQPKVSVGSGVVLGAEALVRWQHPSRGLMFPDQFVPLAENSGLLGPMTRAVLQQGLAWARQWRQSGHDFGIAVNVSPRSLLDVRFLPMVRDALVEGGVPPERVTLEITESSLMDDPRAAIEALGRLRDLGVQLSIDDLGTGYSSLSYLYKLPVTEIKIDRSFLQPATLTESLDVVGGIVDLGHRLGYKVVAEGVEDERTWTQLIEFGCDVAQGYWIGRPVASDAFAQWLDTWPNTLRGVDGPRAVVPAPRQS